jgi:hypothetical protein
MRYRSGTVMTNETVLSDRPQRKLVSFFSDHFVVSVYRVNTWIINEQVREVLAF